MAEETTETEAKELKTTKATKTAKKPEWTGRYEDVTNHQRRIFITESDGTTIEVPFNWPGRPEAEDINELGTAMVQTKIGTHLIQTPGSLHNALLPYFGAMKVDGKVAGELTWKFLEDHESKTANYLFDTADTFLIGKLN